MIHSITFILDGRVAMLRHLELSAEVVTWHRQVKQPHSRQSAGDAQCNNCTHIFALQWCVLWVPGPQCSRNRLQRQEGHGGVHRMSAITHVTPGKNVKGSTSVAGRYMVCALEFDSLLKHVSRCRGRRLKTFVMLFVAHALNCACLLLFPCAHCVGSAHHSAAYITFTALPQNFML
jgi:hypothetical protein